MEIPAAIPTVATAALQGSGQLLVLGSELADGAPEVEDQLVLGVQDAQGVALHPQRHAGKVQRVQGLLSLSLQIDFFFLICNIFWGLMCAEGLENYELYLYGAFRSRPHLRF